MDSSQTAMVFRTDLHSDKLGYLVSFRETQDQWRCLSSGALFPPACPLMNPG